jgi:hypothetical protein
MAERPTWYLDVDGVLNAVPAPAHRLRGQFEHTVLDADDGTGATREVPIWWRPAVVDAINTASRTGLADVVWLTTWGAQASTLLAPRIGLDSFDVVPAGAGEVSPESANWWKVQAIKDRSTAGDRLVFTDDDLSRTTRAALMDRYEPENVLLVTPMSSPGLTDEHLQRVDRFLTQA